MGTARWSPEQWADYVRKRKDIRACDLFSRSMDDDLDPAKMTIRESCDSNMNPLSTPIIVAVDNTGSMGFLAEHLIRKGLGVLIEEIYERKPVSDPHLMCMAVGDAWCDRAPLQATQFEADIRLADQLSKFFIEGGGGGNRFESYNLPWYFAATRTRCDSYLKRNKKGYLFTVGDEPPPPSLLAKHAKKFLGGSLERDLSSQEVLEMASKSWDVYHIMIEEGSYFSACPDETTRGWRGLLGQKALRLSDHNDLAELIVSTIEMAEGADFDTVASSWSGSTAVAVRESLAGLARCPVLSVGRSGGGGNSVLRLTKDWWRP